MKELFDTSRAKIERIPLKFQRFLLTKINWNHKLIAIKGARGVGKTTLMLQYIKRFLPKDESVLYVTLEELFFIDNNLIELANEFVQNGGKYFFLDEVHKYPNWAKEIKLIYDNHPQLFVVFTSSSMLEIYKAEADLSRRVVSYTLPEMSLREFIQLDKGIELPSFSLNDILNHHISISATILDKVKPILAFNQYNLYGAYPFFIEDKKDYHQKLFRVINLIIEVDILAVENIDFLQITKIKKLLFAIATSVPFTPNISKIAEKVQLSRPSLIKALYYLEKARLITLVNKPNKGITALNKPDKIYLNNVNIANVIAKSNINTGMVRESFFLNQLSVNNKANLSPKSDFIINDTFTFEIGGKNKTNKQVQGIKNAYIVKDNIEYGHKNDIPLWLFGFLY